MPAPSSASLVEDKTRRPSARAEIVLEQLEALAKARGGAADLGAVGIGAGHDRGDVVPGHAPIDPQHQERLIVVSERPADLGERVLYFGPEVGGRHAANAGSHARELGGARAAAP